MEKSTVIGMVGGIGSVAVGMALKGADPHALINPAAFLIIFAGTAAAIFNAFPMKDIKRIPKLFKLLFTGKHFTPKQEVLELFVAAAKASKQEGVMAIEKKANEVEDPFIRSAMTMVADGFNADFIYNVLDAEIKQMEERHRSGALVFAQCGMYAPTLGVLGAVIGLIAALGNLSDIDQLGHSIAAASGALVPIATIVRPIIIDGIFRYLAIVELPSTKKSAPFTRRTNPIISNTNDIIIFSSSFLFFQKPYYHK